MQLSKGDHIAAVLKNTETGDPDRIRVNDTANDVKHGRQTRGGSLGLPVLFVWLAKIKTQ